MPRPVRYLLFALFGLLGPVWLGVGAEASAGYNPTTLDSVTSDLSAVSSGMSSSAGAETDVNPLPTGPALPDLWAVSDDAHSGASSSGPAPTGSTAGPMCALLSTPVTPASRSGTRLAIERESIAPTGLLTSLLDPPRGVCR